MVTAGSWPPELLGLAPGIGAVLAGAANVVMQLSWPEVGYGVIESTVERGQLTRHPAKRARTTFTYLAVAMLGSNEERARYREAVNRSHAAVRSGPASPVAYNAFDPELQLWVAACLAYGAVDVAERFAGPLDTATRDALYAASSTFATTLQVPPHRWPATQADFERYWEDGLARVRIDAPVRAYLDGVVHLRFLPAPLPALAGGTNAFWTVGFLPDRFREALGYGWSAYQQRLFDRRIGRLRMLTERLPERARLAPLNAYLWDFRLRSRLGLPLV